MPPSCIHERIQKKLDTTIKIATKDVKWIEEQPYYKEELELNEAINNDIDLEWMIKEKLAAKKRVRIYEEDDATIASYKTTDYIKSF